MSNPPLWLATCRKQPDLWFDDERLPEALAREGVEARPQAWQDIPAREPVLVRTPWDYAEHLPAFRAWLRDRGGLTINPAHRMLWNLDKTYLLELAAAGHAIVPTTVLPGFDAAAVEALRQKAGWDAAIAKPVVGCAAEGLVRVADGQVQTFDLTGNTWSDRKSALPQGPCLVQPFLAEIAAGEWSLFYFGGDFSHAALKEPADDDIRVQEEHGGRTRPGEPPEAARLAADAIAATVSDCTYARVDGVMVGGRFLLMELELIEPELYFRYAPGTEANLARAVAGRLAAVARQE